MNNLFWDIICFNMRFLLFENIALYFFVADIFLTYCHSQSLTGGVRGGHCPPRFVAIKKQTAILCMRRI
jgi:hypothetical protein